MWQEVGWTHCPTDVFLPSSGSWVRLLWWQGLVGVWVIVTVIYRCDRKLVGLIVQLMSFFLDLENKSNVAVVMCRGSRTNVFLHSIGVEPTAFTSDAVHRVPMSWLVQIFLNNRRLQGQSAHNDPEQYWSVNFINPSNGPDLDPVDYKVWSAMQIGYQVFLQKFINSVNLFKATQLKQRKSRNFASLCTVKFL